ncbi:RNA polymerase sigma factor [Chitinophaga sp. GCM10012297]|uniref:Sigma-70 family RNA polymerase sigma factor n=1 Tax=Chitinophaga chungangae TaxID=2821488 RepID=A0ABS3YFS1_9BACT|nr:sigma-70 family RNA polymerase sigma factor [Chitinophaga chungangae]MBO9153524.1 sigma-70 family RNA polymerase sigma factor [Chitinophaga chungangae]
MRRTEHTDADLWRLVQQDDGPAFKCLFDRYWEKLYVYALNRLKSDTDAQDVVQDVLINLWSRRATVSIDTTLAAYLHAAVQYEVLAHIAKASKIAGRREELEKNVLPAFTSFLDLVQLKEMQAIVEAEVARLPEKMQQVYRLRQEKDLSVKEISRLLDVSEQTVRNQLSASYLKLRKHLKEAMLTVIFFQHL